MWRRRDQIWQTLSITVPTSVPFSYYLNPKGVRSFWKYLYQNKYPSADSTNLRLYQIRYNFLRYAEVCYFDSFFVFPNLFTYVPTRRLFAFLVNKSSLFVVITTKLSSIIIWVFESRKLGFNYWNYALAVREYRYLARAFSQNFLENFSHFKAIIMRLI